MLRSGKSIAGYRVRASNGSVGPVEDLYFDDERLAIRFLVVRARRFFLAKRVLLSPVAVSSIDWTAHMVHARLRTGQIRRSPEIHKKLPVSRQKEREVHNHYGWPIYWGGSALWGPSPVPVTSAAYDAAQSEATDDEEKQNHLRSVLEVLGYSLKCGENYIGTLVDMLMEDEFWALHYLVVQLDSGRSVLIATEWLSSISWDESVIRSSLSEEEIKASPPYDPEYLIQHNRSRSADSGRV
jgi:hypothetical protein